MQFAQACQILGVEETADMGQIKQAYRALARKWHPDSNQEEGEAARLFQEIQEAYAYMEVLYAEQQKLQKQQDEVKKRTRLPLMIPEYGHDIRSLIELNLYESFQQSERTIIVKDVRECQNCSGTGNDVESVFVTCEYCEEGSECEYCAGKRTISDEPCLVCSGAGIEEYKKNVLVAIPRSARNGLELKSEGQGGWGRIQRGDLYLEISISEYSHMYRKKEELWVDCPINIFQAVFGGSVWVPGLEGKEYQLQVPPGSSSGTVLAIAEKGFYVEDSDERGDIMANLMVTVPKVLTERQRYFYEQLLALEEGE